MPVVSFFSVCEKDFWQIYRHTSFFKKEERAEMNEIGQCHGTEPLLCSEKRLMHLWKSDNYRAGILASFIQQTLLSTH